MTTDLSRRILTTTSTTKTEDTKVARRNTAENMDSENFDRIKLVQDAGKVRTGTIPNKPNKTRR